MTPYTLLQFPDRLVLVSDEKNYKDKDWFMWKDEIHQFHSDAGYGIKTYTQYNDADGSSEVVNWSNSWGTVIAGHGSLPYVDVSLIAETIGWVDVDSLALAHWHNEYIDAKNEEVKAYIVNDFKAGYFKAQELNKNKFTEEDMLRFARITSGRDQLPNGWTSNSPDYVLTRMAEEKQHPKQWRVGVEMADVIDKSKIMGYSTDEELLSKAQSVPRITNNTIKILIIIE